MDVTFKDGVVIAKRPSKLDPSSDSFARQTEDDREFQEYKRVLKQKRSRSKNSDLEEL